MALFHRLGPSLPSGNEGMVSWAPWRKVLSKYRALPKLLLLLLKTLSGSSGECRSTGFSQGARCEVLNTSTVRLCPHRNPGAFWGVRPRGPGGCWSLNKLKPPRVGLPCSEEDRAHLLLDRAQGQTGPGTSEESIPRVSPGAMPWGHAFTGNFATFTRYRRSWGKHTHITFYIKIIIFFLPQPVWLNG